MSTHVSRSNLETSSCNRGREKHPGGVSNEFLTQALHRMPKLAKGPPPAHLLSELALRKDGQQIFNEPDLTGSVAVPRGWADSGSRP